MTGSLAVDVHVLILNTTPRDWVERCVESIHAAARFAPFKVNLSTLPGVEGHIGIGRARGYAMGDSPYVTYVDDDDYLIEDSFHNVAEALEQQPDAVFPGEYLVNGSRIVECLRRHHLPFYRREHLIDHTKWSVAGDPRQIYALNDKSVIEVSEPLYCYRIHSESASSKLTKEHPEEWEASPPIEKMLRPFASKHQSLERDRHVRR